MAKQNYIEIEDLSALYEELNNQYLKKQNDDLLNLGKYAEQFVYQQNLTKNQRSIDKAHIMHGLLIKKLFNILDENQQHDYDFNNPNIELVLAKNPKAASLLKKKPELLETYNNLEKKLKLAEDCLGLLSDFYKCTSEQVHLDNLLSLFEVSLPKIKGEYLYYVKNVEEELKKEEEEKLEAEKDELNKETDDQDAKKKEEANKNKDINHIGSEVNPDGSNLAQNNKISQDSNQTTSVEQNNETNVDNVDLTGVVTDEGHYGCIYFEG